MLPININQAYKQVVSQENLVKVVDLVKGRYRDLTKAATANKGLSIAITGTVLLAAIAFKMFKNKAVLKSKEIGYSPNVTRNKEALVKALYDQAVAHENLGDLVEAQKAYQLVSCFKNDLSTDKLKEMFITSNYKYAQLTDRKDAFLYSPVSSRIYYAKIADLDADSIPNSCLEAYKVSLSKQVEFYESTGNTRLLQECKDKLSKVS